MNIHTLDNYVEPSQEAPREEKAIPSKPATPVENRIPWVEKHAPGISEIVGQDKAIEETLSFVNSFSKESKNALLLHGPSGNGKTAIAYAVARELGYEIVEMNASDFRTKKAIEEKIGHATQQNSLFSDKGKIILIDEVDGIHGNSDRGGIPALGRIIDSSRFPIIMTANDPWKSNFKSLRLKAKVVKLNRVNIRSAVNRLKVLCEKEGVKASEEVLQAVAKSSDGDLRAAINDLQGLAEGRKEISEEDTASLADRKKEVAIFDTLMTIFKSRDKKEIMDSMWRADKRPEEILLWVAENIAQEYEDPEEVAAAYDAVSKADRYAGRIIHTQAWGMMKYAGDLTGLGVAFAKKEKYSKFTKYQPPAILIKMGRSKFTRAVRDAIAGKVGEACHCSKKVARAQFPYYAMIMKKYELPFDLEDGEIEYLQNY